MGAINLKTSKYFTLCNMRYRDVDEGEVGDTIGEYYEEDLQYLKLYLKEHNLQEEENCVHVTVDIGYYEGYSLDIDVNYNPDLSLVVQAQEILNFEGHCKHLMCEEGMEICHPGWGTKYLTKEEALEELHNGICGMLTDLVKQYDAYMEEKNK